MKQDAGFCVKEDCRDLRGGGWNVQTESDHTERVILLLFLLLLHVKERRDKEVCEAGGASCLWSPDRTRPLFDGGREGGRGVGLSDSLEVWRKVWIPDTRFRSEGDTLKRKWVCSAGLFSHIQTEWDVVSGSRLLLILLQNRWLTRCYWACAELTRMWICCFSSSYVKLNRETFSFGQNTTSPRYYFSLRPNIMTSRLINNENNATTTYCHYFWHVLTTVWASWWIH